MDLLDRAKEAMGAVEGVIAGLPGIKGYKEKELRREADKRVREMLAQKLADEKFRLDGVQEELLGSGNLTLLDDVEKVGKKLQLLIDRIRTATYGYAPFFDAIRVKEEQLDVLAEFDKSLFLDVSKIKQGIDAIAAAIGQAEHEVKAAIRQLAGIIDQTNLDFGHRDEVILQVTDDVEQE